MLTMELTGQAYNKSEHRRALHQLLPGRSEGAIEFKLGNVSALMIELGYPYIRGYQPRKNFQRQALFDEVRHGAASDGLRTFGIPKLKCCDARIYTNLGTQDPHPPARLVPGAPGTCNDQGANHGLSQEPGDADPGREDGSVAASSGWLAELKQTTG